MSNDQLAYNSYCNYCETVNVTPAVYSRWLKITDDANEEF